MDSDLSPRERAFGKHDEKDVWKRHTMLASDDEDLFGGVMVRERGPERRKEVEKEGTGSELTRKTWERVAAARNPRKEADQRGWECRRIGT